MNDQEKSNETKTNPLFSKLKKGLSSTNEILQDASNTVLNSSKQSISIASNSAQKLGAVTKDGLTTIVTTILDQDGDGKLDKEDLKILTEKGKDIASSAAKEVSGLAKEVAKSDLVKNTAAAAAVGAALAIPVPLVGPAAGAVVGAIAGAVSHLRKK